MAKQNNHFIKKLWMHFADDEGSDPAGAGGLGLVRAHLGEGGSLLHGVRRHPVVVSTTNF
jgi:hypothetical protein